MAPGAVARLGAEPGATAPAEFGSRSAPPWRDNRGQATVEIALAFPVVVLMLLALVQVVLVVGDQVAVVHAAREGARAAAVTDGRAADGIAAARAATGLDPSRLTVEIAMGSQVQATVRYRSPTDVPIVGRFLGDVTVQAHAVMRTEP